MSFLRHKQVAASEPVSAAPFVVQAGVCGYRIVRVDPLSTLDMHYSLSAAEYFTRALNSGAAVLDPHACVGCRVVAR